MKRHTQISLALLLAAMTSAAQVLAATLPSNTAVQVRMTERLSSENAKPGDIFHGTLAQPIVVNGKTEFQKGTEVVGRVTVANNSGRLSSPGQLQLELVSISGGWFRSYALTAAPLVIKGGSHIKSNVSKIGGGAATGAIVGGVAAGGKGAAIGAGVGAGAGTVVAAATGKREAVVESEAVLTWVTLGGQPASSNTGQVEKSGYREPREEREREDSHYTKHARRHHDDDDDDRDDDRDRYREGRDRREDSDRDGGFSAHDRIVLRGCLSGGDDYSNLPPGLAKRDRLPPGLEKHIQRNGTLPPGLQKRVRPLPESCELRLPRLPHEWARVILSGRIILLDQTQRVIDILDLHDED
jgi:hypothetical protein